MKMIQIILGIVTIVSVQNLIGMCDLHKEAGAGNLRLVKCFFDRQIEVKLVNAVNDDGETVLKYVKKMMRLNLSFFASWQKAARDDCEQRYLMIIELLRSKGAQEEPVKLGKASIVHH